MSRLLLTLGISFLFYLFANAQSTMINGVVAFMSEAPDGLKAEITITQKGKEYKKLTGEEGEFMFTIPRGNFTLTAKAKGFRDFKKDYTQAEYDASPAIIIEMVDPYTRTRTIDYTVYDECLAQITVVPDKITVVKRLIGTIEKNFTQKDEEYFYGYMVAAGYYNMGGLVKESLVCYTKCLDAYSRYYPFERRNSFAMVTPEQADAIYQSVGGMYISLKLYESGVEYLEVEKARFVNSPFYMTRLTYYHFLCLAYSYMKKYDKALENAAELKKIADQPGRLSQPLERTVLATPEDLADKSLTKAQRDEFIKKQAWADSLVSLRDSLMEGISRLSAQAYYHADIAAVYMNQFNFKELANHNLEFEKITEKQKKLNARYMATWPDYSNQETPEQKAYNERIKKFQALPTGPSVSLIYALCKDNRSEEAKAHITDKLDQAAWDFFTGNYAGTEKILTDYFNQLKEFENDVDLKMAAWNFYRGKLPYYSRAYLLQGKVDKALEYIRRDMAIEETSLQNGFTYFTEVEKKELLRDYTRKLDYYLSVLLNTLDTDKSRLDELVNKVLQTKGIALEYTRKQKKIRKKLSDPESRKQVEELQLLRTKQSSFNELFSKSKDPALRDSLLKNGTKISDLERKLNLKSGEETLFSKVTWQDIQKKLKAGDVYVDILRIERDNFKFEQGVIQYWGIVIKPGKALPEVFMLGEGKAFEGKNLMYYQNMIRAKMGDDDSYKFYWEKIGARIAGNQRVYFMPDGIYNLINPSTFQNPSNHAFVLDQYDLVRLSSARAFVEDIGTSEPITSLSLLGNPDFAMHRKGAGASGVATQVDYTGFLNTGTRSGFFDLPGTQKELDLIKAMAESKGIKTMTLEKDEASEYNVKKSMTGSVLHFATHGTFDDVMDEADSYLKSKLVLAGAADSEPFTLSDYDRFEDGFLSGYEVIQLDLVQTQLVVLSACETGVGDVEHGDGVWGLQRAFQVAGAHSVMGSLWRINDETTSYFMEKFYDSWLKGSSLTDSHRNAMMQTRTKYPNPVDWGAFVLLSR